ncbi:hypothetical protein BJ508DRAFT_132922 [Ascobolus immersus RN42]|uniref:Uncharacterized protein n=1 Tax=Ascobolus immersus RN42 TaxID=1160509 RepID=A0A3N4I5N3_ASCIM|nr:hypothetical protein BJ508DRAFT_132922 [Ascobolus immersus RN42]
MWSWSKAYGRFLDIEANAEPKRFKVPKENRDSISVTVASVEKLALYQNRATVPSISAAPLLISAEEKEPYQKSIQTPPRFDSLIPYFLTETLTPDQKSEYEIAFAKREIKRLVAGVDVSTKTEANETSRASTLIFRCDELEDMLSGSLGRKDDIDLLRQAVELIIACTTIFSFDNENVIAKSFKILGEPEEVVVSWSSVIQGLSALTEDEVSEMAKLKPVVAALVDYISMTVARSLARSTISESTCNGSIAILAKWAMKVKAMSRNPRKFATECMNQEIFHSVGRKYSHGFQVGSHDSNPSERNSKVSALARFTIQDEKKRYADFTGGTAWEGSTLPPLEKFLLENTTLSDTAKFDEGKTYVAEQVLLRKNIVQVLEHLLKTLGHRQLQLLGVSSQLDLCSTVYETGFEKSQVMLMQDWDGEFIGASDLSSVGMAIGGYRVLDDVVSQLSAIRKQTLQPGSSEDEQLMTKRMSIPLHLQWSFHMSVDEDSTQVRDRRPDTNVLLKHLTLSEFISVSVPFAFTSPFVANLLAEREALFNISRRSANAFLEPSMGDSGALGYTASLRITSRQCETCETPGTHGEAGAGHGRSLFEGLYQGLKRIRGISHIDETHKFARHKSDLNRAETIWFPSPDGNSEMMKENEYRQRQILQDIKKIRQKTLKMDKWIYGRSEITVDCSLYVFASVLLGLLLIIGGLVMGFTLGARVPGVDPSNLATYSWAVALLVVLLSQGMRVDVWTWRDYLRGRVRCRSVSELSAMSGIDAELILAKLIHDSTDRNIILHVSGPFHYLFRRTGASLASADDESGFAIDTPLTMRTLLISGIIPLGVYTQKGVALVYLDVRRGTRNAIVRHNSNLARTNNFFCSLHLPLLNKPKKPARNWLGNLTTSHTAEEQSVRIRNQDIGWFKIYGVFCADNVRFV